MSDNKVCIKCGQAEISPVHQGILRSDFHEFKTRKPVSSPSPATEDWMRKAAEKAAKKICHDWMLSRSDEILLKGEVEYAIKAYAPEREKLNALILAAKDACDGAPITYNLTKLRTALKNMEAK